MSYFIRIVDKNNNTIVSDKKFMSKGANYVIGGTNYLEFSITYNYAPLLNKIFPDNKGIFYLNNKTISETKDGLYNHILYLKDDKVQHNYWKCTEGNVRIALIGLYEMAILSPLDARWKIE